MYTYKRLCNYFYNNWCIYLITFILIFDNLIKIKLILIFLNKKKLKKKNLKFVK